MEKAIKSQSQRKKRNIDTYFPNNESSELENRSARLCKETAVTSVRP